MHTPSDMHDGAVQVVWSQLGRVPVEISMDKLYLLARPKSEEELSPAEQASEVRRPALPAAATAPLCRPPGGCMDSLLA